MNAPLGRTRLTEGEFVSAAVGTDKWCVAQRMTDRLRLKGYTVAIHPARYRKLFAAYALEHSVREPEHISRASHTERTTEKGGRE